MSQSSAPITPQQITIAVTVFSRRQYVQQAVASALGQTVPVRVIVVEDCGPDAGLQDYVTGIFGEQIEYVRSPRRRGLFGNWNACLELCRTPWLSILHDDDWLAPEFVEAMQKLHEQAPDCGLYFGQTLVVDEQGNPMPEFARPSLPQPWQRVNLKEALWITPFPFPGQLFRVEAARALGGFRESSFYCGDWEMWAKLIAHCGAAQTSVRVAYNRQHHGWDRGTSQVVRSGRMRPLSYVQVKRNLHLLRQQGEHLPLDRRAYQSRWPVPSRFLLRYGAQLTPRLLAYHVRLLWLSPSPHWRHGCFKWLTRVLGVRFVKLASHLVNCFRHLAERFPRRRFPGTALC